MCFDDIVFQLYLLKSVLINILAAALATTTNNWTLPCTLAGGAALLTSFQS